MPVLTTAQAVVSMLEVNGIDTIYCLPGVQNDAFFDALYDRTKPDRCYLDAAAAKDAVDALQQAATGPENLMPRILAAVEAKATLGEILGRHCNRPAAEVNRDSDRDFFMGAAEAKAYGLIDEIVQTSK